MQTVNFTINHLTGKGWKDMTGSVVVDESIGINAGRDEYATARGTVKQIVRKQTLCQSGTHATLVVNGSKTICMWLNSGKWTDDTKEIK